MFVQRLLNVDSTSVMLDWHWIDVEQASRLLWDDYHSFRATVFYPYGAKFENSGICGQFASSGSTLFPSRFCILKFISLGRRIYSKFADWDLSVSFLAL